jgi:hypothetical protein
MALFQPGAPGRLPGAIGKSTAKVQEIIRRLGVDPFEVMILFVKGDWKALGYDTDVIIKQSSDGKSTFMEYVISPELRAQCAREACKYVYAQRKSVEHVSHNVLESMSTLEKLEAMKQAVKMLEGELVVDSRGLTREVKADG